MSGPVLALAAPTFNAVSETFIAAHARDLAPGRTLLLCEDSLGAEAYGAPALSHLTPPYRWRTPRERLVAGLAGRARRHLFDGLAFDGRMRMAAFLEAHGATVALAEYGPTACLIAPACRDLDLPLYAHFHGFDASILLRDAAMVRRYRRLFDQAAGVITPSRFLADRLAAIGCPEGKLVVNPCGVDPDRFPPGAPEPGRVFAVGRLVEKKAPHLTIAAFARIAGAFPEARLDIVGDGPLRGACEAAVAEAGLQGRVTLHGAQPHAVVAEFMRRAAAFAQHSVTGPDGDTEGFPVAIVEAMACALPVLATRHSGIPEGVVDGQTGLLVDECDVDGMAAALRRLLANPAEAAAMGAAGRARMLARYTQAISHAALRDALGLPHPAQENAT